MSPSTSEVLPAPLGPIRPTIDPRGILKLMSSIATTPPYWMRSASTSSSGAPTAALSGCAPGWVTVLTAGLLSPDPASAGPLLGASVHAALRPTDDGKSTANRTHTVLPGRPPRRVARSRVEGVVGVERGGDQQRRRDVVRGQRVRERVGVAAIAASSIARCSA